MTLLRRFAGFLVLLVLFAPSGVRADAAAQSVVRELYAQLAATMKQGETLGFEGRAKKLDPVIRAAFNLPLMARVATGAGWTTASPQEQADVAEAFSQFSVATYASRFATFDGEVFTVSGEKLSGKDLVVETSLKPTDSPAVTLNYLMRTDDKGAWRIVDVFMNGTISELATRRSEFSSIVRREGMEALARTLGDKAKQMAGK